MFANNSKANDNNNNNNVDSSHTLPETMKFNNFELLVKDDLLISYASF